MGHGLWECNRVESLYQPFYIDQSLATRQEDSEFEIMSRQDMDRVIVEKFTLK